MISVRAAADLRGFNTFGICEPAEHLVEVESLPQLLEALELAERENWPVTVLGGGSNIVLAGPVPGLVICMRSRGRRIVSRERNSVLIEAAAGESWHRLTAWSLDQGLSGLENLSLIPGTTGAAPVQNIGAYGIELADVFDSLDAFDRDTAQVLRFDRQACEFGYRDSVFKRHPGRFIILAVRLRLYRNPQLKVDYEPLRAAWQATGLTRPDSRVVAELVCRIRRAKLPDPARIGNAGSFFKNPVVTTELAERIRVANPAMPSYRQGPDMVKLAAGWLIEQAGWRGLRRGAVGVNPDQALVLVNHGGAKGEEVMALAADIREDVANRFGVELEMEPQVLGYPG